MQPPTCLRELFVNAIIYDKSNNEANMMTNSNAKSMIYFDTGK